jgi:sec-independent protein translocase protein TatC
MTSTATPRDAGDSHADPPDGEMTLVEHLYELRSRLFKCAIAIVAGFVVGFVVRTPVLEFFIRPYCDLPEALRAGSTAFDPDRCQLVFTNVLGAFTISLKTAAIVAVALAAPVVFYQVLKFVTPGLHPHEKKYAIPFAVISGVLFVGGAAFSYVVLPRALEVLLGLAGEDVVSLMSADEYMGFILQMMVAFGLAFELPLILITLILMGIIGSEGLRTYRRHAIFGIFVAAAIITPTVDPLTMSLMAVPLVVFYEGSIVVARVVERRRRRAEV